MDTQAVLRWSSGVAGLALAYHEGSRAPLVLAVSTIAVGASAWVANSRGYNRSPNRNTRRFYPVRVAALLALGLWIGVFLVLSVADSGSESPISTEVPVGFDGAGISAVGLLSHGLLSSIALLALMFALIGNGRRGRRRTSRGSRLRTFAASAGPNSPDDEINVNGHE